MNDHVEEEQEQAFPHSFEVDAMHDSFESDNDYVGEELTHIDFGGLDDEESIANDQVGTVRKERQKKKAALPPAMVRAEHKVKKKAAPAAKAKQQDGLKSRPKRALSAYNLFFQHERKQMFKVGFSDMAKQIGSKWKVISPEDRAHFEALAARDKWRYNTEMGVWTLARQAEKARTMAAQGATAASNAAAEAAATGAAEAAANEPRGRIEGMTTPFQGNTGNYKGDEDGIHYDAEDDFSPMDHLSPTSVTSLSCTAQQQHRPHQHQQHHQEEQEYANKGASVLAFDDDTYETNMIVGNNSNSNSNSNNHRNNMSRHVHFSPTYKRDSNGGGQHNACSGILEALSPPMDAPSSYPFYTVMATTATTTSTSGPPTSSGYTFHQHQSQHQHPNDPPPNYAAYNMLIMNMQQQQQQHQQQSLRRSYSMPSCAATNNIIFSNDMNNQSTNMNNHGFLTNSVSNNSFNFNNNNSLSNTSYQNNDMNNHTSNIRSNMFFPAQPLRSQSARLSRAVSASSNNSIGLGSSSHSNSGGDSSNMREQHDGFVNRMDNDSVDYLVNTFCPP
jgi:hypothetical protein